jgi:hypothetical protein
VLDGVAVDGRHRDRRRPLVVLLVDQLVQVPVVQQPEERARLGFNLIHNLNNWIILSFRLKPFLITSGIYFFHENRF